MDKGLIQVYTGEGKGKTTAAIGQGIRACGRGKRVYMVQFLKGSETGELLTLKNLEPGFKVFRFEKERGFIWSLCESEIKELKSEISKAFEFVKETLKAGACDVLILDEIMAVLSNRLIEFEDLIDIVKNKPENIELILTGRNVPEEIVELADYVSQIGCIKHPFEKGIAAREGIEY